MQWWLSVDRSSEGVNIAVPGFRRAYCTPDCDYPPTAWRGREERASNCHQGRLDPLVLCCWRFILVTVIRHANQSCNNCCCRCNKRYYNSLPSRDPASLCRRWLGAVCGIGMLALLVSRRYGIRLSTRWVHRSKCATSRQVRTELEPPVRRPVDHSTSRVPNFQPSLRCQ
jgi:hypothetical protein